MLDAVRPRVALVSVGADNPYGHPSLPVLKHLTDDGARVLRTDLESDIAVVSTSDGLAVVTDVRSGSPLRNQAGPQPLDMRALLGQAPCGSRLFVSNRAEISFSA